MSDAIFRVGIELDPGNVESSVASVKAAIESLAEIPNQRGAGGNVGEDLPRQIDALRVELEGSLGRFGDAFAAQILHAFDQAVTELRAASTEAIGAVIAPEAVAARATANVRPRDPTTGRFISAAAAGGTEAAGASEADLAEAQRAETRAAARAAAAADESATAAEQGAQQTKSYQERLTEQQNLRLEAARAARVATEEDVQATRTSAAADRRQIEADIRTALEEDLQSIRTQAYQDRQNAYTAAAGDRLQQRLDALGEGGGGPAPPARGGAFGAAFDPANIAQFAAFNLQFQAFFGIQRALTDAISSAVQLDRQLAVVQQQAEAIGQGDQFAALRTSILDTASTTGVAASQVATLAGEFLGLYQNAAAAAIATDNAAKLINVIGASAATAGPQIAAIAEDLGASTLDIGNSVLDIVDKTGRAGTDALAALSLVAPVAKEVNLSLDETRGLVEAVSVGSAKTGQQIGEGLARVIPELQANLGKLVKDGIVLDVKAQTGDAAAALTDLFQQYGQLSSSQQQNVIRDLGGPRNAQILAAALADPKRAMDAFNSTISDNNLLNERNAAAQDTLKGALDRLKQSFVTLGDAILHSGIVTALQDIVNVGGGVIGFLGQIASIVQTVNSALGGFPARILEVALAFKALGAISSVSVFGFLSAPIGLLDTILSAAVAGITSLIAMLKTLIGVREEDTVAATEQAAATTAETGAEEVNAAAAETVTGAQSAEAIARTAGAGTAGLEAGALGAGAVAGVAPVAEAGTFGAFAAGGSSAAIPVAGLVIAAALVLRQKFTSDVQKKVTATDQAFSKLTDDQLRKVAEDGSKTPVGRPGDIGTPIIKFLEPYGGPLTGLSGLLGGAAAGGTTERQAAQKALNERLVASQQDAFQAISEAGLVDAKDAAKIQKELQDPGKASNFKDLEKQYNEIAATPKGQAVIAASKATQARNDVLANLSANLADDFTQVSDVVTAYQSGEIDYASALSDMQQIAAADVQVAGTSTAASKQALKDMADLQKFVSSNIVANVTSLADFQKNFLGQGPQVEITDYLQALTGPDSTQLTVADRAALGQKLLQAEHDTYNKALAEATSITDINNMLTQGYQVSVEAADAANKAAAAANLQLPFPQLAAVLAQRQAIAQGALGGVLGAPDPGALTQTLANLPAVTAPTLPATAADVQTGLQNAKALADLRTATAQALGAGALQMAQLKQQSDQQTLATLQAAQAAHPDIDLSAQITAAATAIQQDQVAINQAILARYQAEAAFFQTLFKNDPLQAAQAGLAAVRQEIAASPYSNIGRVMADIRSGSASAEEYQLGQQYVQGQQAVTDAQNQIADAQAQYAADLAKTSGDALGAARANVSKIQGEMSRLAAQGGAGGAAYIALEDQMLSAQSDLRDTQNQIIDAQISYAEALATAAGDPVRAGQLKIQELQTQIAQLRATGATTGNSPQLLGLLGQLAQAQSDQISTFINTAVQQNQNALDLRRIGVGQAINNLEATLKQAAAMGANQTQLDNLQIQINNLIKQTEGQLSWNLGTITVPTLYEARRLEATTGAGSGYQDNRTQAITITVNNAQDNQGAVNTLLDAVGGPSRTGTALPVLSAL